MAAACAARLAPLGARLQLRALLPAGLRHERTPGQRAQLNDAQAQMALHLGVLAYKHIHILYLFI